MYYNKFVLLYLQQKSTVKISTSKLFKIYILSFKYVHIQIIPFLNSELLVQVVYFDSHYSNISYTGSLETQVSCNFWIESIHLLVCNNSSFKSEVNLGRMIRNTVYFSCPTIHMYLKSIFESKLSFFFVPKRDMSLIIFFSLKTLSC